MLETKRRLIVVEDESLILDLLVHELERAGFDVRSASNAAEGRALVDSFDPDVMLLDVDLGAGPSGIHLAHALAASRPDIAILILTKYPNSRSASDDGLDLPDNVGFLQKHLVRDTKYLLSALEKVLTDKAVEVRPELDNSNRLNLLNAKQFQILKLLADGYVNIEIANRTGSSAKSVERQIDRIYALLKIETRGEINSRVAAAKIYYLEIGAVPRR